MLLKVMIRPHVVSSHSLSLCYLQSYTCLQSAIFSSICMREYSILFKFSSIAAESPPNNKWWQTVSKATWTYYSCNDDSNDGEIQRVALTKTLTFCQEQPFRKWCFHSKIWALLSHHFFSFTRPFYLLAALLPGTCSRLMDVRPMVVQWVSNTGNWMEPWGPLFKSNLVSGKILNSLKKRPSCSKIKTTSSPSTN